MKVLLLDKKTIGIMSVVYSKTRMQAKQVFHTHVLAKHIQRKKMEYLKCIVFVRPTKENVEILCDELKSPKYKEYRIFFSNVVAAEHVGQLADADRDERVTQVMEYYADFYAVGRRLYHLGIDAGVFSMSAKRRAVDGIVGALLALKKRPSIRYSGNSAEAQEFARAVHAIVRDEDTKSEGLFQMGGGEDGAVQLLIMDRRDDPVTPLLNQWTYQAMVHELVDPQGIWYNRVTVRVDGKEQQLTLSEADDEFFAQHMYDNFGDIGVAVKGAMQSMLSQKQRQKQMQSIEEMQSLLATMPETMRQQNNTSKHVNLVGEIARLQKRQQLLKVSRLEQEIACGSASKRGHFGQLKELLRDATITAKLQMVKLVMIFALRYEKSGCGTETAELKSILERKGVSAASIRLVDDLVAYAGRQRRSGDLFKERRSLISQVRQNVKSELRGVQNIYTQHRPLVDDLMTQMLSGKLSESDFPFKTSPMRGAPRNIMIFIIGGATYEEAMCVGKRSTGGVSAVLGSTCMLKSVQFLSIVKEVMEATGGRGAPSSNPFESKF
jgi:vacuolar protein sorting-associated protein 45